MKNLKKNLNQNKIFFENLAIIVFRKVELSVRGDLWWHLDWKNGIPYTSLRVDLKTVILII